MPRSSTSLAAVREDEVVRERLVVGEEVLLDHFGPVAEAEHEVGVPPRRVPLHDVPEDRPSADGDHRLGNLLRRVTHANAETPAEDDDFHKPTLIPVPGNSDSSSAA